MRLRSTLVGAVLTVLVLGGCAPGASPTQPSYDSRIKVDTPQLRKAKAAAGIAPCPEVGGSAGGRSDLPDLTLPCLGGGPPVDLSSVQGPAVVTVWAQWCGPCRHELPYFERLARTGKVEVLGVDWKETSPSGAIGLLAATKATFPQVIDLDGRLSDHYKITGLPGILFVDAAGTVTFRPGEMRSYDELTGLVQDHTGVDVTGG
jgi:thiol-disulfide isomerase/thioredoxin